MKRNELAALLHKSPVIAAVRTPEAAVRAAASKSPVAFLLGGSILTVADDMKPLRAAGKRVFLHLDLLASQRHSKCNFSHHLDSCVKFQHPMVQLQSFLLPCYPYFLHRQNLLQ